MALRSCSGCQRHLMGGGSSCPFCGHAAVGMLSPAAPRLAALVAGGLLISACAVLVPNPTPVYGAPAPPLSPSPSPSGSPGN